MSGRPFFGFADRVPAQSGSAYEQDFFSWTQDQAKALRKTRPAGIDWENLAEAVETLGRTDRLTLRTRLTSLVAQLLRWHYLPAHRSRSWQAGIGEHRAAIGAILDGSPSLRTLPGQLLPAAHRRARTRAMRDTGLPLARFPERPPYDIAQVLDQGFLPGPSWSPDDLIRD